MDRRPIALAAVAVAVTAAGADQRLLYVFAADAASPPLRAQRAAADPAADAERDLRRIEVVGTGGQATALRRRFGVAPGTFRVILIGKDGGVKLTSAHPLAAAALAETIDAMPMRRGEMRH